MDQARFSDDYVLELLIGRDNVVEAAGVEGEGVGCCWGLIEHDLIALVRKLDHVLGECCGRELEQVVGGADEERIVGGVLEDGCEVHVAAFPGERVAEGGDLSGFAKKNAADLSVLVIVVVEGENTINELKEAKSVSEGVREHELHALEGYFEEG